MHKDTMTLRIHEKLTELDYTAKRVFGIEEFNYTVNTKTKGRVAGWYSYDGANHELRFNLDIAMRHPDEFIDKTVIHEYAHMIVQIKKNDWRNPDKVRSHGREWQWVMTKLGATDISRTHSFITTPARKTQKFLYTCDTCNNNWVFGLTRHNRNESCLEEKGKSYYICPACRKRGKRSAVVYVDRIE